MSCADDTVGDVVRYVVNRNINYTNVCTFRCQFCAFSKGKLSENLRGQPYDLALEEVVTARARSVGARRDRSVHAGRHPSRLHRRDLSRALPRGEVGRAAHARPRLLAAGSGARRAARLNLSVEEFLHRLRDAGLGTLPGTAAEILDDEVRRVICPDKLDTEHGCRRSRRPIASASGPPRRSCSATSRAIEHWARHLLRVRALQARTGGFTEFVPLPFVHMEAPMYLKGRARKGRPCARRC